jgi:hypothetical protein
MAITPRFRVEMGDVFPHGAYVVGEVEKIKDFDKSGPERFVQAEDRESGLPLWAVPVHDADPAIRKASQKTVTVKIAAKVQPVPPEAVGGLPFRPVEFTGLVVVPYVMEGAGRPRVAYSIRAESMAAPGRSKNSGNSGQSAA